MPTKNYLLFTFLFLTSCVSKDHALHHFTADNKHLRYTGRGDFSDPLRPRFYQPGAYMEANFEGSSCKIIVHDQQLWGEKQNYLEIVLDGKNSRLQSTGATDTIDMQVSGNGLHQLLVCKSTEANIGWLEFGGLICEKLLPLPPAPERKIEFIGNSITCGTGADDSQIPCHAGKWEDQHNAYLAYGPLTARALNAQWHLSSVSGIGLIHSCCEMDVVMPPVFDNVDMRGDSIEWDFSKYQPDVLTICLGQNDGVQDSTAFCEAYLGFIESLRGHYPQAEIVLLTSPMADGVLLPVLKNYLSAVVEAVHARGDQKVDKFYFSKQSVSGCDYHPNLAEHAQIATELTDFLKGKMGW